jgi:hypothetical protein
LRSLRTTVLPLFVFASVAAFGQTNYGTIRGSVSDAQHKVIAGATLSLVSRNTDARRTTVTNENGFYEFAGVLPTDYELEAAAKGFGTSARLVKVEVGQQLALDFSLKIGEVKETLEVAGWSDVLKTTDSSVGEVIESKSVNELPLNGRMLIDLVLTVPGAHLSHGAQTGDMNPLYWRPGQRSAVSLAGARPNANYFLLDGSTNTDPTFNTQNLSPSPDAVQEFKVQTGSYSAEMGGAGGGQINVVTRSGGKSFHGTVYEFHRNGALDAHTFNDMGSNHLVQNNFGASLGGPIKKLGNTFFFVNYEGLRRVKAMTMVQTVPTEMEKMGDFSMSGVTIYNPFSAHTNPSYDPTKPISPTNPQIIRDPFPDNMIPQELINPAAQMFLMDYVVNPNLDGGMPGGGGMPGMGGTPGAGGVGTTVNNLMDARNERHRNDQGTVRIDHHLGNGDSITGRYSISSEGGFMPQNLPGFGALHDNLSQHGQLAWNRVISPSLLNIATFTVSRLAMHRSSENSASNDIVSALGIQGVGFGGAGAYGAPWFNVQGYSGMGDSFAATPMHAWDTLLEWRDTLSWQRGKHSLKFGGSYRRYIWPMWGFFQNRGYYQFTNGFTTQTATNDGTGSALASFLLGLPAVRQRQAGIPEMDLRQWYADGFAQDTWRIREGTTLDFGLRYDYMSPLYDLKYTNTNLMFADDGTPSVFIGGQQGHPKGLMYSRKANFAPRVGLAQHFGRLGLVAHAAYGIFYTPVDMNTWCNQRHNVPFVFPETNQSDNFIPAINGFNFGDPVLGKTTVSFAAFDPDAPAQYIQQWSASLEKSIGKETTVEIGYIGSRGFHLQRSHLINNAVPGPGPIGPRRPFKTLSFISGAELPDDVDVFSTTFPVSGINLLENTARSWYDAGYVNVRRRYARGLSLLANYTWAKNLSDAPDFRSPMFESAIPQDNNNLAGEKGPSCDIRHRLAVSAVYDLPHVNFNWVAPITRDWHLSAVYQVQTGFPFTISVFGDTANAGTLLGENPIRANVTGEPIFGPGTHNAEQWFNPMAFATPAAFTFGNAGRNSVYGPGLQTLDLALSRDFAIGERTKFQFRGEFFNALNHTNLGTPNRFVNTPQFGTITEAATPGREVQLSARLSF